LSHGNPRNAISLQALLYDALYASLAPAAGRLGAPLEANLHASVLWEEAKLRLMGPFKHAL
jgi:hypothetical protein